MRLWMTFLVLACLAAPGLAGEKAGDPGPGAAGGTPPAGAAPPAKPLGLQTYSAPAKAPRSDAFAVRAREAGGPWIDLFTYKAGMGTMSFISFDSDFAKPVEVEVRRKEGKIEAVKIRPASAKVAAQTAGDRITFSLAGPTKVSVEVNGDTNNNLMVFANPREEKPVAGPGPGVHFFGPGEHALGGDGRGTLKLADGDTVYIAGGAIVYGNIEAKDVKNVTIRGRGILRGCQFHVAPQKKVHLVRMEKVTDASIEGIVLLDTTTWNVLLSSCERVRVSNVKIMARQTYSDGINPVDSRQVTIDGCFIRNEDDCFSIKLRHKDTKTPIGGCRDITIQNCLLWPDRGRSLLIGPESSGDGRREYADITFRNVDILRIRNHEAGDWALGALAINCGDGSTVKNLLIEDVRVEGQENGNLINFRIVKTEFNLDAGSRIENVTVRNVTLAGKNAVGNAIVGQDAARCIDGVRFQNLSIDGKVIRSAAEGGFTIQNAKNVTFEP